MNWDYNILAEVYDTLSEDRRIAISKAVTILGDYMRRRDREIFFDFIYEAGVQCRQTKIKRQIAASVPRHSADPDTGPGKAFDVGPWVTPSHLDDWLAQWQAKAKVAEGRGKTEKVKPGVYSPNEYMRAVGKTEKVKPKVKRIKIRAKK